MADEDTLTTSQITHALTKCLVTSEKFVGVFPFDGLPTQFVERPAMLVCNTAYSKSPGEHWVAWYLDHKTNEYFDSYGLFPRGQNFMDFMMVNQMTNLIFNYTPFQSLFATTCGKYVCTYLYYRAKDCTLEEFKHGLGKEPDKNVKKMYKNIFGSGGGCCSREGDQKCYKYTCH